MSKMIIGIQGGKGSYNDVAIQKYLEDNNIHDHKIIYLNNTEDVLEKLRLKQITHGQFATKNSIGGPVEETVEALKKHTNLGAGIIILSEYEIPIAHCLMCHQSASLDTITEIRSHSQTFLQCKENLEASFCHLKQVPGKGAYLDPARIAQGISEGEFGENIATLSNPKIADLYDVKIISGELQDREDNITTFQLVLLNDQP
ncbi:hypothetical protein CS022_18330 [Veronia nyctiphanis]|uniref:prephenate dehydratase n=1 Tax=Veronia nyctiphanis TaxID=1278244 RepID=A0A4Q0YSM5_9GAMM|nr:prephenate dehydratase domain-containing protein [Veronia nyctiphanis]RXJ71961.1 hypothetical protein CS022_18330 [Veronia nyctiphanis]